MESYWLETLILSLTFCVPVWLIAVIAKQLLRKHTNIQPAEIAGLGIATLCGYFYYLFLAFWFAHSPEYNPLYLWLIENKTQSVWFRPLVLAQDIGQQFLLGIPVAVLLLRIRPPQLALYLLVFILPSFLMAYRSFIFEPELLSDWPQFLPGALFHLTVFPITYLCVYKALAYRAARRREK